MQHLPSAQLSLSYQHIYLSPHIDDAALSCGGAIAAQARCGEHVLVISICTALPPASLSAFARHLHQQWGDPISPMETRRREDEAALAALGADLLRADAYDAIYRHPAYDSVAAIFASPAADDPLPAQLKAYLAPLIERYPAAHWYVPLAVGNHVDHQLTFASAAPLRAAGAQIAWYEDLPYACREPAAVQARIKQLGLAVREQRVDISAAIARKLGAIAAYASQMKELFGSEGQMVIQVERYAASLAAAGATHAERLWLPEELA